MSGRHASDDPVDAAPGADGVAAPVPDGVAAEPTGDATIRVVSGDPSPEELAAVTAILAALAAEEAARAAEVVAVPIESAWSQSRRPLRQPMHPGPAQWGRYPA